MPFPQVYPQKTWTTSAWEKFRSISSQRRFSGPWWRLFEFGGGNLQAIPGKRRYGAVNASVDMAKKIRNTLDVSYRILYHICIDMKYTIHNTGEYEMARDGITFEQVAAAADGLMGAGQQPTIRGIRESLGTGSPNTVHKHLSAWRAARPQAVATVATLPASLTAAIAAEIERAAAQARAEIEARLVQAQAEAADLAGAGEVLEADQAALAEQVAALTSERDTLAGRTAQQAADIAAQVQQIGREQAAAEAARLEVATARVKIEQRAEQRAEQAVELARLRAALDEIQHARQQAEQQAAVAAAHLEGMADRATRAESRIDQLEKRATAVARELVSANAAVQAGQARLESAAREIEDAKKAASDARTAAKKSGEEAAELRGRMAGEDAAQLSGKMESKSEQAAALPGTHQGK
jgi:colicin import membrane protein